MKNVTDVAARLAMIAYLFVVGVIITAAPWTTLWPISIPGMPWLTMLIINPALRGAVSGFGLVLIGGAVVEASHAFSRNQ